MKMKYENSTVNPKLLSRFAVTPEDSVKQRPMPAAVIRVTPGPDAILKARQKVRQLIAGGLPKGGWQ